MINKNLSVLSTLTEPISFFTLIRNIIRKSLNS